MENNIINIYYFPRTQHITTNIWLKYVEVENIIQRNNNFKNDTDINTILNGGTWYYISVSRQFLKNGIVHDKIKSLVSQFNGEILKEENDDCYYVSQYTNHTVTHLPYNIKDYKEYSPEHLIMKLITCDNMLVQRIKNIGVMTTKNI